MIDAKGNPVFKVIEGFQIRPTQQTMSNAFEMPIPFETAAGAWHTNINSSLTLKPRQSPASRFSQAVLALADEMRCWSWLLMRNR
jgi:hypothetical protein